MASQHILFYWKGRKRLNGNMDMKKYEYVSLHIGKLFGSKSKDHKQIIDEYAKKGYRYVGYIPTKISDYGKIIDMDLVFEMDV